MDRKCLKTHWDGRFSGNIKADRALHFVPQLLHQIFVLLGHPLQLLSHTFGPFLIIGPLSLPPPLGRCRLLRIPTGVSRHSLGAPALLLLVYLKLHLKSLLFRPILHGRSNLLKLFVNKEPCWLNPGIVRCCHRTVSLLCNE